MFVRICSRLVSSFLSFAVSTSQSEIFKLSKPNKRGSFKKTVKYNSKFNLKLSPEFIPSNPRRLSITSLIKFATSPASSCHFLLSRSIYSPSSRSQRSIIFYEAEISTLNENRTAHAWCLPDFESPSLGLFLDPWCLHWRPVSQWTKIKK